MTTLSPDDPFFDGYEGNKFEIISLINGRVTELWFGGFPKYRDYGSEVDPVRIALEEYRRGLITLNNEDDSTEE